MENPLRDIHLPENMLKHFIYFSMFCPIFFTKMGVSYSPDLIVVNLFAVVYLTAVIYQKRIRLTKGMVFVPLFCLLLVCFNIFSFYVNQMHLSWYYGQINVSISFLLFLALYLTEDSKEKDRSLDLFLRVAVISNAIGLIPYFLNYYSFSVKNGGFYLIPMNGQFDERRYSWFYYHKSEYAFMLLLFLSLIIMYRDRFTSKKTFYFSIGVMVVGLVISNTRTSILSSAAIFIGWLLDEICKKPKQVRKRYWLLLIPIVLFIAIMLVLVSRRRDLLSLGSRTYIWKASLHEIRENPYGIGTLCGQRSFPVPVWPYDAYNCHNVFLNILLQFSIPAGFFYILMLLVIIVGSIKRRPCFLTLGAWASLLVAMNMDWCLLLQQLSVFLVGVYFLFYHKEQTVTASHAN